MSAAFDLPLDVQEGAAEFVPLFYLHRARYVECAGAAAARCWGLGTLLKPRWDPC
jgi:hypothetical protein